MLKNITGNQAGIKASGLRAILERFATYFGLRLSFLVFSTTEQLSMTLQGKDINTHDALSAAEMTKTFLQRQRSDSAFASFYQAVAKEAESLTNEPAVLPRRQGYLHASPTEYFRQQYFEVFDILYIIAETSRRFDRPVFTIMQEMETLLLQYLVLPNLSNQVQHLNQCTKMIWISTILNSS